MPIGRERRRQANNQRKNAAAMDIACSMPKRDAAKKQRVEAGMMPIAYR